MAWPQVSTTEFPTIRRPIQKQLLYGWDDSGQTWSAIDAGGFTNQSGRLDGINTRLDTANTNLASQGTTLTSINANITSFSSASHTDLGVLHSDLSVINTTASNTNTALATLHTDNVALKASVDALAMAEAVNVTTQSATSTIAIASTNTIKTGAGKVYAFQCTGIVQIMDNTTVIWTTVGGSNMNFTTPLRFNTSLKVSSVLGAGISIQYS